MFRYRYSAITLSFVLMALAVPVAASESGKKIVLVADKWCPYNCSPKSKKPGILVEIAKHAFALSGYKVVYKVRPWNRSIVMVRNGDFDGVIGAGKEETPDFVFPDMPLATIEHTFYVGSDSSWKYTGLESLSTMRLGVIKNYSYGDLYHQYINKYEADTSRLTVLHGEDALDRLVALLERDRINAFVESKNIVASFQRKFPERSSFKPAGVASIENIYIAFSPQNTASKEYARILSEGYRSLRKSGKLDALLEKYHLAP